jgi:23S rRNA (guanine2445-N2)-methyltransferase / 23S rRNA (guanine2069-N7)-methyltransferase
VTPTLICARGVEHVLASELKDLGLPGFLETGVCYLEGGLEDAYRAVIWSRVAARVLVPLLEFPGDDPQTLYDAINAIPWQEHFGIGDTFAIDVAVAKGRSDHSRFLAQRAKDAIVDHFRDATGERPNVDVESPDVRLHLHWSRTATLSVDLAGPLHRRGYRPKGALAPLRETLAAALLRLSEWTPDKPLLDPMCGSGTFVVEAACQARRIAPGKNIRLGRWRGNDHDRFRSLQEEARAGEDHDRPLMIYARDRDPEAIALCRESLALAGVQGVDLACGDFKDLTPPDGEPGHVVINPPYGERLGERGELLMLYPLIGDVLKQKFGGWQAHVLASDKHLGARVGLKPKRKAAVFNGSLDCRFSSYDVRAAVGDSIPRWRKPREESSMFGNRLRKNRKRLKGWAKGAKLEAWRVYDADIPEYNVALDVYGDRVLLQEHRRPHSVDPALADDRLNDAILLAAEVMGVAEENVHVRVRHRQQGSQYEKRSSSGERFPVSEGELLFEVNLDDYLDTGLFLDHRSLRKMCADAAAGASFLNLFAYTCTASVYAAAKGARVTSVDLSGRYLDWGKSNFRRNGLEPLEHSFVRSDVVRWLSGHSGRYECVLLAPPSYSKSKSMSGDLDLKRDHVSLIEDAYGCLTSGGVLFFSTHARAFELDAELAARLGAEDITTQTVPRDFPKGPHRTWRFVRP